MFDVENTRHKFLVSLQSIFGLKNDFRSIQVTQEGRLAVYIDAIGS